MRYEEPPSLDREEVEAVLAGDDASRIPGVLVGAAFDADEPSWVLAWCERLSTHPDVWVRRICATCVGHLARIHGELDEETAVRVLRALAADPACRGTVEDALSDLQVFTGRDLAARVGVGG